MNDHDVGLILQEAKDGQCLQWKDTADCNPIYEILSSVEIPSSKGWHAEALLTAG